LIKRILKTIEKLKTDLLPRIESFESSVTSFLGGGLGTTESKLIDTHHLIEENLMQTLFTLDDVTCPEELETARKKRRAAVKYTQGLIDRVDGVKERLYY
jgi:hypothetical protein